MRRIIITLILVFASLPWLDSPSAHRSPGPAGPRAAMIFPDLRDLVPASALLAIEVNNLDRRWGEIRAVKAIALFQDSLLSSAGISPDLVPALAGAQAVVFLAPLERRPFLLPVAILRPTDMRQAEIAASEYGRLACRQASGVLWLGPAGSEDALADLAATEDARLHDVLPFSEIEERLPRGGLVRGWLNPAAWTAFLRDFRERSGDAMFRWAASAAAAELTAVRYIAFRRELAEGQLAVDGVVAYDIARLPHQISRVLDPAASAVFLPSEPPPHTLALAAFRPEAQAWLAWLRYLAALDPHGPLRNAGFWIDEFQQRFHRNLEQELLRALGERAWLAASLAEDGGSVNLAWVFEARPAQTLGPIMLDLFNWLGERIRLRTLGAVVAKSHSATRSGVDLHGLWLQTPFSRIPGPSFQIYGDYLIFAGNHAAMHAGRALVENIRQFDPDVALAYPGLPVHGTMLVQGAELARLIRSSAHASSSSSFIREAIEILAAELESLKIEIQYERDAVRFRDRLNFAGRREDDRKP